MIRRIIVLCAIFFAVSAAAALGQEVSYLTIQYWHPLQGEGATGSFDCDEPIHMTDEENIQVSVFCDTSTYDCYQSLWYYLESGDELLPPELSSSGGADFPWVEVDDDEELLRARIGDGPWCDLDNHIWNMPEERCDFLLQRVYFDCFLFILDEGGHPLSLPAAQADCAEFDERWQCFVDCVITYDDCPGYNSCINVCFPEGPDDDDSADDDSADDDSADDDSADDDSADDDSADDDSGDDDAGDDDVDRQPGGGDDEGSDSCGCEG